MHWTALECIGMNWNAGGCVGMRRNAAECDSQQLQYSFHSQAPLSFNLHYHEEGVTHYPVKEDSIDELENIFQPEKRGYYCLMWGNPGEKEAKMDYHFKILNRSFSKD